MSNPNRPNGGILERFVGAYIPILGVTFSGAMTTNSPDVPNYKLKRSTSRISTIRSRTSRPIR